MWPEEIAIIVRSDAQAPRAHRAAEHAGAESVLLDPRSERMAGKIAVCTMHLAKGLEFRAVAIVAADENIVPLEERLEAVTDEADLEEVYHTERHLLYVACTRARDQLLLSGVSPISEFVQDLQARAPRAGGPVGGGDAPSDGRGAPCSVP